LVTQPLWLEIPWIRFIWVRISHKLILLTLNFYFVPFLWCTWESVRHGNIERVSWKAFNDFHISYVYCMICIIHLMKSPIWVSSGAACMRSWRNFRALKKNPGTRTTYSRNTTTTVRTVGCDVGGRLLTHTKWLWFI
jgi:hypothetical protein